MDNQRDFNNPFLTGSEFEKIEKPSDILKIKVNGVWKDITRAEFEQMKNGWENYSKKCIDTYGDYADISCGFLIIKEDGEYRQISKEDKRYNVLFKYIFDNHHERYRHHKAISDYEYTEIYSFYVMAKNYKIFPEAKPMENHGILEKDFNGELFVMMCAFYEYSKYHKFHGLTGEIGTLENFCLSLGMDYSIYIHKYMQQKMDYDVYFSLKEMSSLNLSKEKYYEYRRDLSARFVNNAFLPPDAKFVLPKEFEERKEYKKRVKKEVDMIEWHL